MAENWIAYMSRVEDEVASFIVDLDAGESYDIADYPARIEVTLPCKRGESDEGLPGDETIARLNEAEDYFVSALGEKLEAVHVGHATRPTRRTLVFFAPGATNLDDAVAAVAKGSDYPGATATVTGDEEWSGYFDFLYPTPTEFQWLLNCQLVETLEEAGVPLEVERHVDHVAMFCTEAGRSTFEKSVRAQGFRIDEKSELTGDEAGELPFELKFSRAHAVDMDTISEITIPLVELAVENDGVYDGWGTGLPPS